MKFELESFLGVYYKTMYEEYCKLNVKYLEGIYKCYVPDDICQKIEKKIITSFCTYLVSPNDEMIAEIQLYVDLYVSHRFYICAEFDIREYTETIIHAERFKHLVFLMFYIKDYINPIEFNLLTISH